MYQATMTRRSLIAGASLAAGALGIASGVTLAKADEGAADEAWDLETDVVVIGFGGSGAASAIGAADAGANVILLEKAPEEFCGGNTSVCGGSAIYPDDNDMEGFREFIKMQMPNTVTDEEVYAFCDEVEGLRDWVTSHGGTIAEVPYPGVLYGTAPHAAACEGIFSVPGSSATSFQIVDENGNLVDATSGTGATLFAFLKETVESMPNITIMYETPAQHLIFDPDTKEIFGVQASNAGKDIRIKAARGVVMACGGFEGNTYMMNQFYKPNIDIFPEGTPYNTGDGLVMISEIGAKIRHFASIEWGCQCCAEASREMGCAVGTSFTNMDVWNNSIEVNKLGKRFVAEAAWAYPTGSKRPLHQKSNCPELDFDPATLDYANSPFYYICDNQRASDGALMDGCSAAATSEWANVKNVYTWSDDNQVEVEKGWLKKADTLEELAEQLGIDPDGLVETVANYNAACEAGYDEECGRELMLTPITEPPFYGCELCMTVINTQGGPERDGHHRVISYDDEPIPRLYAAGEFGSIYGYLYQGSGNVAEALCGNYAGAEVASLEPWD